FVAMPGFTADCLETIDEIGYEAREVFRHAGGKELHPCPCLNAHPRWVEAMRTLVEEEGRGWVLLGGWNATLGTWWISCCLQEARMLDFLDAARTAAERGAAVLEHWRQRFSVREKARADLVTEADLASQQTIRDYLLGRFPGHSFLGEEEGRGDA